MASSPAFSIDAHRVIVDALPHIVWAASPSGEILYVNRRGDEYLGLRPGESYGTGWIDTLHPEDAERAVRAWERALAAEEPYELEYRLRRHDGSYRWHADAGSPIRGPGGGVEAWIGTLIDVDTRVVSEGVARDAEQRTSRALALLETLLDKAPTGFAFIDTGFRFVRVNEALAEMNGVAASDHLGRTVEEVAPELWPLLRPIYEQVLTSGESNLEREITGETAARPGVVRSWEAGFFPIRLESGEILGIGIIARETTEAKQQQSAIDARLRQQAAAAELGQAAIRGQPEQQTMDTAASLVASALSVELASVFRLEHGEEAMRLVAGEGWSEDLIGDVVVASGPGSPAGRALLGDDPVVVGDPSSPESRFGIPSPHDRHGVVSEISAAIRVRDEPWGVIAAHARGRRDFSEHDANFLQSVAHLLSGAFEAARAERERRLYEAVLTRMEEGVSILRLDERTSVVEYANAGFARMLGYSASEIIGVDSTSFLRPGTMSEEDRARARATLIGTGHWNGELQAITKQGEARVFEAHVAVLDRDGDRPRAAFVAADVTESRLAQAQLEVRLSQQAAVAELGQIALRERSVEATTAAAVELLAARLDADLCSVMRLDPAAGDLLLTSGHGWPPERLGEARIAAGPGSQARFALMSDEPVVIPDLRDDDRFTPAPELLDSGAVSAITTSIRLRGEPWGVTDVNARQARRFSDDDVNFVRSITHVVSAVLESAEADDARALYGAVLDGMADGVVIWRLGTPLGRIEYVNPSFEASFGYGSGELRDFAVDALSAESEARTTEIIAAMKASLASRRTWSGEARGLAATGDVRVFDVRVTLLDEFAPGARCVGVTTDVTEIRRIETARSRADALRRQLLAELVRAQEAERRRIAADIHDDTLQTLSAIKLRLGLLRQNRENRRQAETLGGLERDVQDAMAGLRSVLFELRPPALAEGGVEPALRDLLDQLTDGGGPRGRIEGTLDSKLSLETATVVYRIAREALANVRRHAESESVEVTLAEVRGSVYVRVRDFGVGFSPEQELGRPGHLGLVSMRERAELAGGWARIHSSPGAGTTVEFAIPRDPERDAPSPNGRSA